MHAGQGRRSLRQPTGALAVALAVTAASSPALAGDLDFRLNGGVGTGDDRVQPLVLGDAATGFAPNNAAFQDFVTQLAFVLAPRLATPAETLGHSGFHLSAMWSGSLVSGDESYWLITEQGSRTGRSADLVQTLQVDLRKGLPLSFEVGANFMWLAESELFAPGVELRWAFQEGYRSIPDVSIRGALNHLVGNRDLELTVVAADVMFSKSFGVAGMVNLTPYIGWSLIFINASSRVIDPTPIDPDDVANNFVFQDVDLGDDLNHKLTTGVRMLYHVLNVSVQGEFQLFDDYQTGGDGVITVTTKLGVDY